MPTVPGSANSEASTTPIEQQAPTQESPPPEPVTPQPVEPKRDVSSIEAPSPIEVTKKDYAQQAVSNFENAGKLFVSNDEKSKESSIAAFSSIDGTPDEAAKIYDLSLKTGLPSEYVKDNIQEVEKNALKNSFDFNEYQTKSPKYTDWLSKSQENVPLVKDELKYYSDFEKQLSEYSTLQAARDVLGTGLSSLGSFMGALPATAFEAAMFPRNLTAYVMDRPDLEIRAPESLRNNFIKKYYDDAGKLFKEQSPLLSADIARLASAGNYSGVAKSMFAHAATNAPNLVLMATMPGLSSLFLMGAQSASESITSDEAQNVPAATSLVAGAAKGVAEAGFERLGTFQVLKKWTDSLTKNVGKQARLEIIKNFSQMLVAGSLQEGAEEAGTTYAQSLTDYFSGINPNALDTINQDALISAGVGGMSGAGLSSIAGISRGYIQNYSRKRAEDEKNLFLSIGETAEKSKLKARLPKKFQELFAQITKDGSVENFYMDVGVFDKAFENYEQGGIAGAIRAFGVEQSYEAAKESGGKIQLKSANWATASDLATFSKVANDITFDPNGISVNENKAASEQFYQSQQEEDQSADGVTAAEIEKKLVEANRDPMMARNESKLFSKAINNMSNRFGIPISFNGNERTLNISDATQANKFAPDQILKSPNLDPILNNIRQGIEPKQTGKTILQFIRGMGGIKPGGLSADVAELEKGIKGRKLVNNKGLDIDQIAMRAVESGYLQEGDINQLIEAIKSEIAGSPVYPIAKEQSDQDIEYQAIKSMLSNLGIDLNTVDNATAMKMISENRGSEKESEVFLQMAGQRSKTADKSKLAKAFSMNESGSDMETIRKETGWFMGPDKRWRYEISDKDAKFKDIDLNKKKKYRLDQVIEHQDLFDAYPQLKETEIQFGPHKGSKGGHFSLDDKKIKVNVPLENVLSMRGKDASKRIAEITKTEEYKNYQAAYQADIEKDSDIIARQKARNVYRDSGLMGEMMGLTLLMNKEIGRRYPTELQEHTMGILLHEIQHSIQNIEGFAPGANSRVDGRVGYRNSLGEVEARDAADRRGLSPEERADKTPSTQTWSNPVIKWADVTAELPIEDIPSAMLEKFNLGDQMRLFQSKNKQPRGSVEITRDQLGKSKIYDIKFLENADKSTFLHESAHVFLEIMADLAEDPNASAEGKQLYVDTLKYLGVKNRSQIKEKHHEKFAESFEKYLSEGNAPTKELQSMFDMFKSWIISVYKSIEQVYPKLKLNDNIRSIFDRLIVSDEELQMARTQAGSEPMIKDFAGVLNAEDAAKLQQYIDKEQGEQSRKMAAEAMKTLSKEYQEKKKAKEEEIRPEIEDQVALEPEQQTLRAVRDGVMPNGEVLPEGVATLKLNRKEVKNMVRPEVFAAMPKGTMETDGAHPNAVANILYGPLGTGSDLIMVLSNTPDFDVRVDQVMKERMRQEMPDPALDGTLAREASKVVHSEAALNRKQFEIDLMFKNETAKAKKLTKKITARKITNEQFKKRAELIIGMTQIRDIRPHVYRNQERKNANIATELFMKGDLTGAIDAKQKEILNGELYKLALKVDKDIDGSLRSYGAIFKPDDELAKRYNMDTLNAARSLLSLYGVGRAAKKSPEEYLSHVKEYSPDIYNSVIQYLSAAMLNAKDYRELSYNEFVDMDNSFEQLKEIASLENKIKIQDKMLNKRDIIDNELLPQLAEVKGDAKDRPLRGNTPMERTSFYLGTIKSAMTRTEAWVVGMDNGKFDGAFRKYIFDPVYNSVIKYRIIKNEVLGSFKSLLEKNKSLFTEEDIVAYELVGVNGQPHTFVGMKELLGAILHTGNLSNKRKLLIGYGWGSKNEDGELDDSKWQSFIDRMIKEEKLTKAHFDLIQETWDLMEGLKKDAQNAHKELYGFNFNEVTSQSFVTPFGVYKGGYAPAITDKSIVRNPKDYHLDVEEEESYNWWPSNPNGFTKARQENYTKPLLLDLRLVPNHVDSVLRFSHISVPVKNVKSILSDRAFSDALVKYDPTIISGLLEPWMGRALNQRSNATTDIPGLDKFFTQLRSLQGAGIMFLNVRNTLQQFTGLLVATAKVDIKHLRTSTYNVIKNGKDVAAFAVEMSEFMKTKISFTNDNIVGDIQNIVDAPSKTETVDQWFKKNAYILQSVAQGKVDLIVWNAAFQQAKDQGANDKVAVQQADSAVRLTQGTFAPEDVSSIESGNPFFKVFTMFYSYYNTIANLYGTEVKLAINSDLGLKQKAARLFYLYGVSFALPAVMAQAIMSAVSGNPILGDDDDDYITRALEVFFAPQARTVTGMAPFVGPVANSIIARFDKNALNDRISFSPVFRLIESGAESTANMIKGYPKGFKKKDAQYLLGVMSMFGAAPGVPFIPFQSLSNPTGYIMDVKSGKARPEGPVDVIQGILSGSQGKK
jgi:hypothetical protein